jgi:ubiquinol-cytochrome c reductase cytochrome b subunit
MAFGFLVVVAILVLAVVVGAPEIGAPPNPSDIHSNPRPDWYLLWIFALFALMPPQIESVIMAFGPPLVGLILILLPIMAGKGERSPLRRPWAIGIVVFIVMVVAVFWYEGTKSPWSPDFQAKELPKEVVGEVSQEAMEGSQLFFDKGCLYCHTIAGHGGKRGPELTHVGARLNDEQLTLKIVNGGGNMPAYGSSLNEKELRALISFLKTRN